MCNFSRLVNLGIKTLVNDLYQTTTNPVKFKREVYTMLEGVKKSRNVLLGKVEGELDAARRDPYRVNGRPVDFGDGHKLSYNPDLLEAIGKLLPVGESTDVSQDLDKVFKKVNRFKTLFPTPHSIFVGEVNSEGEKEGMGVLINNMTSLGKEEDAFHSSFMNSEFKESMLFTRMGNETTVYFGSFKHNEFDGMGTHIDAKGNRYEGTFVKGKRDGHGKITYANDNIYEGYWKNDLKHGFGVQ